MSLDDSIRIALEDSMGIKRTSDDAHGWCDQSTRKCIRVVSYVQRNTTKDILKRVYNP